MIKTFSDAVKFLEGFIPPPDRKHIGRLGFERMEYFVHLLGDPHLSYPTIHVGGTSGKGSTATIIASILATKYKVGLNTSPHLEKITERIKIKNKSASWRTSIIEENISEAQFVEILNQITPFIEKMKRSKYGVPSHFEITTGMAFLYFLEKKVDVAVIEVGMGGRWDGTNVIRPEVAILTNVGLDHTQVLGETVEKIAQDKVGIIKRGIRVVSGAKQSSVVQIINAKCEEEKARLSLLIPPPSRSPSATWKVSSGYFSYQMKKLTSVGSVFDYFGEKIYNNLELSLLGVHQVENATLAIRAIEQLSNNPITPASSAGGQLNNKPIVVDEDDIRHGLKRAFIPGRLEIVKSSPIIVLDGAHNPDKIEALVGSMREIFPEKKITCILAIKKDKDARKMIQILLPICRKFILTQFLLATDQGDTYSYESEELSEIVQQFDRDKSIYVISDSEEAVRKAIQQSHKDDLILVTGSLYLVGEIRSTICH